MAGVRCCRLSVGVDRHLTPNLESPYVGKASGTQTNPPQSRADQSALSPEGQDLQKCPPRRTWRGNFRNLFYWFSMGRMTSENKCHRYKRGTAEASIGSHPRRSSLNSSSGQKGRGFKQVNQICHQTSSVWLTNLTHRKETHR